ncbi:MAG TPA: VUT family protein [Alphaproteobacteria bacterium]|nr:VUT family protein [Alphaproteobacteria bacterium]
MSKLLSFKFTLLYVALIVLVNYGFSVTPLVKLPDGTMWPPMSLVVGFIFVVRDFAQREIGHKVLIAMLVGAALSYVMADPHVAIASAAAFLVSELADWLIYSLTKRPLSQRIIYSSLLSAPLDSAVFLFGVGFFSVAGVVTMTISKLLGAFVVWWLIRRREMTGGLKTI